MMSLERELYFQFAKTKIFKLNEKCKVIADFFVLLQMFSNVFRRKPEFLGPGLPIL